MRECNLYELMNFMAEQYDAGNSVRFQDYETLINDVPYRGMLLNSGHALLAQSYFDHTQMGDLVYAHPRFFILDPPARGEAR